MREKFRLSSTLNITIHPPLSSRISTTGNSSFLASAIACAMKSLA